MSIERCHRCRRSPRECECFPYFARSSMFAAILPGLLTVSVVKREGWFRLDVEIGEETTSKELRAAIPTILAWRDGLQRFQGPWTRGGIKQLLKQMSDSQRGKDEPHWSYAEWARQLNTSLGRWLEEYCMAVGAIAKPKDYREWRYGGEFARKRAAAVLRALGYKAKNVETLLSRAVDQIRSLGPGRAGQPARRQRPDPARDVMERLALTAKMFEGLPVDADRVRGAIRAWRARFGTNSREG